LEMMQQASLLNPTACFAALGWASTQRCLTTTQ
jgi:hypothetical protein